MKKKRAAKSAQTAQEDINFYRQLVELSPDLMGIVVEQKIALVNTSGAKLLGAASPEQLIGQSILDFALPNHRIKIAERIQHIHSDGEILPPTEQTWLRLDGSTIDVEVTAAPFLYQDIPAIQVIAYDIAQRKQVKRALQESEKRYKLLLGSVTDYIYTVKLKDGQPVATIHGAGCTTVTGYTPEEYERDPYLWYRMIHWEDRPDVSQQITHVLDGKTVLPREHRIVHKNGSIRWVRNTSVPRYDESGRLVAYDGLVSDITEQKLAEEKLRSTLAKTQTLYHVARSLVTLESLADLLQTVTDSVAEALAADRVILILVDLDQQQVTHFAMGGPGIENVVLAPFDELMEGLSGWAIKESKPAISPKGKPDLRESARVRKRRAETNCGSIIVAPLHYRNKTLGTMTVVNRPDQLDFTEQDADLVMALVNQMVITIENTRLFEEMGRLKTFNENIVQSIAEVILIEDTQGYFTFANPAVQELLGYAPEELIGQHWSTIIHEEHVEQVRRETARRMEGRTSRYETNAMSKDRQNIPVIISARPLFKDGEFIGVLAALTDITARKQAEEALHQYAAQLQARNEELDAFAHTVAHDLKHTLSIMIGLGETLESEQARADLSAKELDEHLAKIAQRGRKMNNIIEELLLLSSVRQMKEVRIEPLDMAGIVAEAQERLSDLIGDYEAEIISPKHWLIALGYAPWVEEIWVNYISNAIKYGGQPPRVELGATLQANGTVSFWVRDNGPGLTPQEQVRLFTPFTRLEQARGRGYGLGLSIVRRIVEKLGGQVKVESQTGQGSTFSFTLPGITQRSQYHAEYSL